MHSSTSTSQATQESDPSLEGAPRGFFADQFENSANFLAHFEGTGPEIWRQTTGNIDAFVSGAGVTPFQPGYGDRHRHLVLQGPGALYLDAGNFSKVQILASRSYLLILKALVCITKSNTA